MVDPTGEIPTILAGGFLGGLFGGGAGFIGSMLSQVTDGRKIDWRKAAGSAANGAVVGAAKGALVGSGVGVFGTFAIDFTAGSVGDALEQKITTGRVELGRSLLGGAENALSEMLYGTGELKGVGDAFRRGAKTGAVMSGLKNLTDASGGYGLAGDRIFGRKPKKSIITGSTGRDPKRMCGSPDPFDLADGFGNGRGHGGAGHSRTGEGGFSLGGLVKDMVIAGILGGLGSAGFYGAGKAVDALKSSVVGCKDSGRLRNAGEVRYREGRIVDPLEVTYDMRLNPEEYAYAVADKYGINLRGSGQRIIITFDPGHVKGPGLSKELDPTNIILGPQALISEEELARTISHELNHARSWLKGGRAPEDTARAAEIALGDFINGGR